MKFPSLSLTLNLLSPFSKSAQKPVPKQVSDMNSYDLIEEIVSIANMDSNNLDIVVKFYDLNEIQQQLTIVTLIEHNMTDAVRLLLQSNFGINFLIRGQTPLHFAIQEQNSVIINLLLKHKADLELTDKYKETALHCAVRVGSAEIVKLLLDQGSELNVQASDSSTSLDFAVQNGDVESMDILEKHGAISRNPSHSLD